MKFLAMMAILVALHLSATPLEKSPQKEIKLEHSGDATLKMLEPVLSLTAVMMGGAFDDVGSHMRERGFKKSQSGNKLQDNIPTK